ncbi:MAG: methionyl-tRNA formyltransferase [Candidatus Brocadiae bacterium]|nr:methionyl-tRNA formyltransferase [Candidatus Brocadiia bacterium]
MNIIFLGTPSFAVPALEILCENGHTISAVITQPDRPQGRNQKELVPPPVKVYAQSKGLKVYQVESPNKKEFIDELKSYHPDLMVLAAYGKILCKDILNLCAPGIWNIHFSLLPKHRGASPVLASMLSGDQETGISIMKLVSKMDAGPVCSQAFLPIEPKITRENLEEKLGKLAAPLLIDTIEKWKRKELVFQEQDESKATYCSIIKKEQGKISWECEASYIERFIRAMIPWPCAYSTLNTKSSSYTILLKEAEALQGNPDEVPGKVVQVLSDGIVVATGKHYLKILSLQKSGKRTMMASEFLRGNPVKPGDFLS